MPSRGIYLRGQVTPFVILFIERDGSTFVVSMLSDHPDIEIVYERFAVMIEQEKSGQEQLEWLDDFYSPSLINRMKAVGFKTKLKDILDMEGFTKMLHEKQVHVIHMQRRNIIKAIVSKINARRLHNKTGNWNLYKETNRLPPAVIDLDQFDAFLKEREERDRQLNEYVAGLDIPKITVCYEDLLQDRDAMLRQVFEFLNVKWVPVEAKTKKNTKDDLREVIENYDELRARYADTPYDALFDEVIVTR